MPEKPEMSDMETQTEQEQTEISTQTEVHSKSIGIQEVPTSYSIAIQGKPYETKPIHIQTDAKEYFDLGV